MGFDAGTVAEPLDWTFVAFGTLDDKGTIPEPSRDDCDLFQNRYTGLLQAIWKHTQVAVVGAQGAAKESTEDDADAAMTIFERLDLWVSESRVEPEAAARINDEVIAIVTDLCHGSPTEAQLRLLPSRQFRAFVAWLNEQITNPKFNFAESASNA